MRTLVLKLRQSICNEGTFCEVMETLCLLGIVSATILAMMPLV